MGKFIYLSRYKKELWRYISYTLLSVYITCIQQLGSHESGSLAEGAVSIHTFIDACFGIIQCITIFIVILTADSSLDDEHITAREHKLRGLLGLLSVIALTYIAFHVYEEAEERLSLEEVVEPLKIVIFTSLALLGNIGQILLFRHHHNQTEKTSYYHGTIDLGQNFLLIILAIVLIWNKEYATKIDAYATIVIIGGIGLLILYLLYRAIGVLSGKIKPKAHEYCFHS